MSDQKPIEEPLSREEIKLFADSFSDRAGASDFVCACGVQYYEDDSSYSWEEGELEAMKADPEAIEERCSLMSFEGRTYVIECKCWHPRARRIMGFLDSHSYKICDYINNKKAAAVKAASAMPSVTV